MLTDERCKQLMTELGMPNSQSLYGALHQVANETEQAVRAEVRAEAQEPAKSKFDKLMGDVNETPIERLRFFCSLAISNQDWLDIEPFFDALTAPQPPAPCPKCVELDRWLEAGVYFTNTEYEVEVENLNALQAKVAELEYAIESQRLAMLDLSAKYLKQAALIDKCEKALIWHVEMTRPLSNTDEALSAITAHRSQS